MSWNIQKPGDYINGPLTVVGVAQFNSNVGVGVAPSAWNSNYNAIDIGANGSIAGRLGTSNTVDVLSNAFRNSSGNWVYKFNGPASRYQADGSTGAHFLLSAASGVAGATISWVTALALNLNGALALNGGNAAANGVGIAFPAAQSASTDANTLDDYEEGTWTPVYTPASGAFGALGAVNTGYYRKIGDTVYIWGAVRTSGTPNLGTASGNLYISGLPFQVTSVDGGNGQVSIMQQFNLSSAFTNMGVIFEINQSRLYLTKNSSNSPVSYVQATELSTVNQSFGNLLGFFGMYRV